MLTKREKEAVLATADNNGIPVWWVPAELGWTRTFELQRIAKRYRRFVCFRTGRYAIVPQQQEEP